VQLALQVRSEQRDHKDQLVQLVRKVRRARRARRATREIQVPKGHKVRREPPALQARKAPPGLRAQQEQPARKDRKVFRGRKARSAQSDRRHSIRWESGWQARVTFSNNLGTSPKSVRILPSNANAIAAGAVSQCGVKFQLRRLRRQRTRWQFDL
jgi:hypothetical protein